MAAATLQLPVRAPRWTLSYKGVNITAKIDPEVISVTYIDRVAGGTPEVEVELQDAAKRWQGPWYPIKGDEITLSIGYVGESSIVAGDFEIDDLELKGPPDVLKMRALAAGIRPALRTPNTVGYEKQTLLQVATAIATKYGYTVVGVPNAINVQFSRQTQKQETDLAFLRRLANEHNYDFSVRTSSPGGATTKQLVFYSRPQLEARAAIATIHRANVTKFGFRDKTHHIYKQAICTYLDPNTKKQITQTVAADPPVPTGDTLKLRERVDNGQSALLKAQGALHTANMLQTRCTIA